MQPRIGGDEGALNIPWVPLLLVMRGGELRRDGDRLPCPTHIGEIIRRALARTGAMDGPFMPREALIRINAFRLVEGDLRRVAASRPAVRRIAVGILRPEPVHDKTEIAALRTLIGRFFIAARLTKTRRPGKRQNIKIEIARRDRSAWPYRLDAIGLRRRGALRSSGGGASFCSVCGGSGFLSAQLSRRQSLEDPLCAIAGCAPPAERPKTRIKAAKRRLAETVMSSDLQRGIEHEGVRAANRSQLQRKLKRDRSGRYGPARLQSGAAA